MSAVQRPVCDPYCMAPPGSHHPSCPAAQEVTAGPARTGGTSDETQLPTEPRLRVAVELMGIYAPYLPTDYHLRRWLADADVILAALAALR